MKNQVLFIVLITLFITTNAFSGMIKPGEVASCQDANSITMEVAKIPNKSNDKFGYTSNDRGTANLVLWKSSNFTTVPITLGPNDSMERMNGKDKGRTGIVPGDGMGRSKVTLNAMPNFSRGDSIGDIRGLVKITNTGVVPAKVSCNK